MKEDYDTIGPEATIQTTVNNGTGKSCLEPPNPICPMSCTFNKSKGKKHSSFSTSRT